MGSISTAMMSRQSKAEQITPQPNNNSLLPCIRLVRKLQKRPSRESGNPDGRRCSLDSCLRRNDDKDAGRQLPNKSIIPNEVCTHRRQDHQCKSGGNPNRNVHCPDRVQHSRNKFPIHNSSEFPVKQNRVILIFERLKMPNATSVTDHNKIIALIRRAYTLSRSSP